MFSRTTPFHPFVKHLSLLVFIGIQLLFSISTIAQDKTGIGADLTAQINQQFLGRSQLFAKPILVDDATFARRVAIDLTGMPLSTDQLQVFLADKSADKRSKLVDELLSTPQSTRQIANWLNLTLLERRTPKITNDDLWMAFLMDIVRQDKSLADLTKDLLTATGEEGPKQTAARFFMDRDAEPNLMTRDIGRVFLGRDMQCNQCHDHPLVDGYLQSDYQSLLAFVQPTSVTTFQIAGKPVTQLTEKAGGRVLFDSVFVKDDSLLTGPRIPGNETATDPALIPGNEYNRRQSATAAAAPKNSRRTMLADAVIASPVFSQNWANRIWALMLGRGIVHPLDFSHRDNPPINEPLLNLLAGNFKANGYRIRPLLRAIVLSQPYQSPFDFNDQLAGAVPPGDMAELKSELDRQQSELKTREEAFSQSRADWHKALTAIVPVQKSRDVLQAKLDEFGGKQDAAITRLNDIITRLNQIAAQHPALSDAKSATEKALAALPGDKELDAAVKAITDKLTKIDAERTALTDEQGKKAVERRTAEEQLAAFRVQAKAIEAQLTPLVDAANKLEQPFLKHRAELDAQITAINRTKNEIEWQETRSAYARDQEKVKNLNFQIAQLEPMAAGKQAELEAGIALIANLQMQSDAQSARYSELAKAIEQLSKDAQNSELALIAMKKSDQEFQNAAKLLGPMADLGQLQSGLQMKSDEIAATLNQRKAALAVKSAELNTQQAERQATKTALAARRTEQIQLADHTAKMQVELAELSKRRNEFLTTAKSLEETLVRLATNRFEMAQLKPLGPEIFAWSIMRTTGVYDNYWRSEEAALNKAQPPSDVQKADPGWLKERSIAIEAAVYAKLKGYPNHFVNLYGAGAGQPQSDFFATADQALYLANGGTVASWCMPSAGNPADGLVKAKTPVDAANALYQGVLGRKPEPDEILAVTEILAKATDKTRAVIAQDLVWGLLTSPEYRFNH